MRIKFLGTGASEATPAMFCKCRICENARAKGGKEMRTRAGVLVDEKLMIDFSPDAYWHVRNYGLDMTKVKSLIVTHSHSDHFCADDLTNNRNHALQSFEPNYVHPSPLKVYGNEFVIEMAKAGCESNATQGSLVYNRVDYWQTFETEGYTITSLPTEHMRGSMGFLIEKERETYLHLCDSGEIKEEVFAFLKEKQVKVDFAVLDATYGFLQENYFGHLNLNQLVEICQRFKDDGIFNDETKVYLTHIGHSGKCTHEELEKKAGEHGINVAYDGLDIEL